MRRILFIALVLTLAGCSAAPQIRDWTWTKTGNRDSSYSATLKTRFEKHRLSYQFELTDETLKARLRRVSETLDWSGPPANSQITAIDVSFYDQNGFKVDQLIIPQAKASELVSPPDTKYGPIAVGWKSIDSADRREDISSAASRIDIEFKPAEVSDSQMQK